VGSCHVCSPFGRRTDGVGGVMFWADARVVAPTSAGPYGCVDAVVMGAVGERWRCYEDEG
jgi:hypothetical protein